MKNGRPPIDPCAPSVPVLLRLSAASYDALYERAQRARVTVPEVIRRDLAQTARARGILTFNASLWRVPSQQEWRCERE